jgi:hypothetical protein
MKKMLMMLNREIKRVPLDFDHPLNRVWSGYLITNKIEPPKGKGYQCWETTSEGSPISPVFKTFEELCEWLSKNSRGYLTDKFSKEDWVNALKDSCPVVDMATKELELADKNLVKR